MVEESKEEGKEEDKEEESKEEKLGTMAAPKRKLEYYENPLLASVNERDSKKKEAFGKKI